MRLGVRRRLGKRVEFVVKFLGLGNVFVERYTQQVF